jgi:coenzyme PQQ precursor peptide PqqA
MEWETPEFVEISLACEISGYASAELSAPISAVPSDGPSSRKN